MRSAASSVLDGRRAGRSGTVGSGTADIGDVVVVASIATNASRFNDMPAFNCNSARFCADRAHVSNERAKLLRTRAPRRQRH
jgi:hypothetical protein